MKRQTDRCSDRNVDRQKDRQTERQIDKLIYILGETHSIGLGTTLAERCSEKIDR